MARIEQAIFTSAHTDHAAGYQVVATSPGVLDVDRRELAIWGPSHDSLLDLGPQAESVNFHPLPSGAFCVSRTVPSGWEYSGRGGHRIYTHCLIAAAEDLAAFGNSPLALLHAALAAGALRIESAAAGDLEPLDLQAEPPAAELTALVRLAEQIGPTRVAMLVQTVMNAACVAVSGPVPLVQLVGGLLDCLPPECRTALWFSTGLKFSSRRPFRLIALPADPAARRWLAHHGGVSVLDLTGAAPPESEVVDDWPRLLVRTLAGGHVAFLAEQLAHCRPEFTLDDLPALGLQLFEELDDTLLHQPSESGRRAHAAHHRFEKSLQTKAAVKEIPLPSEQLDPETPEAIAQLETLDDLVYDGINGDAEALEQLKAFWPTLRQELGEDFLAESREQYLRYALSIWDDNMSADTPRNPIRAVQAIEVLCVLFDAVG